MAKPRRLEQIEYLMGIIGAMMLIVYWLVIATIPELFFISPVTQDNALRRAELVLSTIGWIASSTLAPLCLFIYSAGYHNARKFLPYTALIWPISLAISQITVYIQDGSFYLDYLLHYPIFFYTDLVLPIFILFIWYDLGDHRPNHESMQI